jgi:hypothetical protein
VYTTLCIQVVCRCQSERRQHDTESRGNSQLQSNVGIYPISEVLCYIFGIEICVLNFVCEVFDDFEQGHSSRDQ